MRARPALRIPATIWCRRRLRRGSAAGRFPVPPPPPPRPGLPPARFAFEGFVPARPAARRAFYAQLRGASRTIICFETGRRLTASLEDLVAALGERPIVVAREVTKLYEEFVRGAASQVREQLAGQPVRGEVTLLIAAAAEPAKAESPDDIRRAVARLRAEGLGLKQIARTLAREGGWSAREGYRIGLELGGGGGGGLLRQQKMRAATCRFVSDLITADIVGKEVAFSTRNRYGHRTGSLREH